MPRSCCSRPGALLLALLFQASVEVRGLCLESSQCQDLTTESNLLACLRACQPTRSAETPVFPGDGAELPLTENSRKYVMGHLGWDRLGRRDGSGAAGAGPKRASEAGAAGDGGLGPRGEDDGEGAAPGPREGKRSYSMEHFRWGKPVGRKRRPVKVNPNGAEDEVAEAFPLQVKREGPEPALDAAVAPPRKKDREPYKMEHFRWGKPPKNKRYGGFMTSEKGQTPLVTLFKNAIPKNAQQRGP